MKKLVISTLVLSLFTTSLFSQRTIRYTEPDAVLKNAEYFCNLGLFEDANAQLRYLPNGPSRNTRSQHPFDVAKAEYLQGLCNLFLHHLDAERNFRDFLDTISIQSIQQIGYFQLGKYYFNKGNFERAIPCYEKSGIAYLTNKEISERNFELGYSYLVTQQLDKVKPLFSSVKDIPGEYFKPGNYYHGLLSYYNKDYDQATQSFTQAAQDLRYKNIIPFYLTEIDYLTGQKDKARKNAEAYLQQPEKLYYNNELNQLLAQIYFDKKDFKNAEKYFMRYMQTCESPRKEDYFRLGYAQYQQLKNPEAIAQFEKMNKGNDELSQMAWYFLARTYLRNGEKEKAYQSLNAAVQLDTASTMSEISYFNLAKLSYELGHDEEADHLFTRFLKDYPNSKYRAEAIELQTYLHIKHDRFDDAIAAINDLPTIPTSLKKVYQKANYARGLQMMEANQAEKSIFYLHESQRFPIDAKTLQLTSFWLAEAYYRMGQYPSALQAADDYLTNGENMEDLANRKKMHLLKSYVYLSQNDQLNLRREYSMIADTSTTDPSTVLGTMKSNFSPERIPIVDNDPYLIVYNLPELTPSFTYTPVPLKPLSFDQPKNQVSYKNFIKMAVGNVSTFTFESGVSLSEYAEFPLYVHLKHTSSKGSIDFQRSGETQIGLTGSYTLPHYVVDAQLRLDKRKFYYYGYNHQLYDYSNTDIKQTYTNVGLASSIRPLKKNRHDIDYKATIYAGIYADKFQANESNVRFSVPMTKEIDHDLSVGVQVDADVNAYNVSGNLVQTNSMLALKPSLNYLWNDVTFHVGISPTLGKEFHLLPDITAQYSLNRINSVVSVGWQSNLQLNTFKELTTTNPFIFNYNKVTQTKHQEWFVALKGNARQNFSFSCKTGLALIHNLPLFINDTAGDFKQFNVVYDKQATSFIFDVAMDYVVNKNLFAGARLNLKPVLSLSSQQEAWHYVPAQMDIFGKIKITPSVLLRTDIFLRAGSKVIEKNPVVNTSYTKSLYTGMDMNLGGQFILRQDWDLTIDVNNLFNSAYQRWYGYQNYGTNVQVGLLYSFNKLKFTK